MAVKEGKIPGPRSAVDFFLLLCCFVFQAVSLNNMTASGMNISAHKAKAVAT